MSDNPRIEELRRRVHMDPASIAFAALAEEYRRAGRFEEAVATCEAGLTRHPAYLSARVTLGRALLELSRFDDARAQLEQVLRVAPENLAAIRALAEIHGRAASDHVLDHVHAVVAAAETAAPEAAAPSAERAREALAAPEQSRAPAAEKEVPPAVAAPTPIPIRLAHATTAPLTPLERPSAPPEKALAPALEGLESFLAAILRAREELGSGSAIR